MDASDEQLRRLINAIVDGDTASFQQFLARAPELARASFRTGATRTAEQGFLLERIKRWIYSGDTALHFAAGGYRVDAVNALIAAGADVHAPNRHGHTPLHSAAAGIPGSASRNPQAQAATISALIKAGSDPNAIDRRGVAPLHIAARTRCASAVQALLDNGADPALPNGKGSTPMLLAAKNTGRGGSGSPEAHAEREAILLMLHRATKKDGEQP